MIRLYVKVPLEFTRVILRERGWVLHITICSYGQILISCTFPTLPNQSCLVSYPFCADLLHSLTMWLIVLSLSPHNIHLLFCHVLIYSRFVMIGSYALFCTAIRSFSVSLLKFPFISQVQVFSRKKPNCKSEIFWKVEIAGLSPSEDIRAHSGIVPENLDKLTREQEN